MQCFTWNGEQMHPVRPRAADREFVIGQRYWLEQVSERSWASHSHQFAWLQTAWENLPEQLSDEFPSPTHLRRAALIACGWFRETIIDAGSKAAALRVAAYVRGEDEFASVIVRGSVVIVRKARSQAMHGHDRMDKAEFEKSKSDILGWIANLIGVEPEQLSGAA